MYFQAITPIEQLELPFIISLNVFLITFIFHTNQVALVHLISLSLSLSLSLCVCVSVCLSVCLYVCLSVSCTLAECYLYPELIPFIIYITSSIDLPWVSSERYLCIKFLSPQYFLITF